MNKAFPACLMALLMASMTSLTPVLAVDYSAPAFPLFLNDLPHMKKRQSRPPGFININLADLNQLTAIPTVSENIALKIIRYRPYFQPADLRKIPSLPANELDRLVKITATRFQFDTSDGDRLRQ